MRTHMDESVSASLLLALPKDTRIYTCFSLGIAPGCDRMCDTCRSRRSREASELHGRSEPPFFFNTRRRASCLREVA